MNSSFSLKSPYPTHLLRLTIKEKRSSRLHACSHSHNTFIAVHPDQLHRHLWIRYIKYLCRDFCTRDPTMSPLLGEFYKWRDGQQRHLYSIISCKHGEVGTCEQLSPSLQHFPEFIKLATAKPHHSETYQCQTNPQRDKNPHPLCTPIQVLVCLFFYSNTALPTLSAFWAEPRCQKCWRQSPSHCQGS